MVTRYSFLVVAMLASAAPVTADEMSAGTATRGLVVHDATTVFQQYCALDSEGTLWLTLSGGQRFELITSTLDPEIANPGDGSYHPFGLAEVETAIREIGFPLDGVAVEIYILPYPRRGALSSAAGPGLILLSPGVRELTPEHQHAELVHELGHTVQYAHMPDVDTEQWNAYRALRGITDDSIYSSGAPHENRPHEIFAEDFRVLFGGALAAGSGAIENHSLIPPVQVQGLREFISGLATSGILSPTVAVVSCICYAHTDRCGDVMLGS